MGIDQFWDIVLQNASHISVLNGEMGAVQAELVSIGGLMKWVLGCMSATFFVVLAALIASLKNLNWTKKTVNGNGNTNVKK